GKRPVASPLPFHLSYRADGTPVASFHVARNNPLATLAGRDEPWLLAVRGADASVSPEWYASPEQVPTWLYEAVHLSGPATLISRDRMLAHLDELTQDFERPADGAPAWSSGRLTAARREAMMNAIVAIEMEIETVEGVAKLSQTKTDADFQAVAMHLRAQDDVMARQISARMVALRPDLSYEEAIEELSHG
ncbi:MAG: FMN-binding negative transcriptional regulator, partial [Xanthobacteraceae bacterium]